MPRRKVEDIHNSGDEAEEVHEEIEDVNDTPIENSEGEEEGEDLDEDAERDYAPIQELDRYEEEGIDDGEVEEDLQGRAKAEKALDKRDRNQLAAAEVDDYLDDELSEDLRSQNRRKAIYFEDEDE
jgi:hypothetical protein